MGLESARCASFFFFPFGGSMYLREDVADTVAYSSVYQWERGRR